MEKVWSTATVSVDTPRGRRWQGVSFEGHGRTSMDPPPRGANIVYRSPLRIKANEAFEQARARTIHHNVWHDGSEWATSEEGRTRHAAYARRFRCPEAARA